VGDDVGIDQWWRWRRVICGSGSVFGCEVLVAAEGVAKSQLAWVN